MLDVCLLGSGGMLPLPKRFLTALLVRHEGSNILIDCGEGTQVALHLSGYSVKNIDHIFITHFHGDHVSGLPGLLMTIGNNHRTEPLHLWGGQGLEQIMAGLMVICPNLPFPLEIHELPFKAGSRFMAGELEIQTLPVQHRVPCLAYSLHLPRKGKFDIARAQALGVPVRQWKVLQNGEAIQHEGRLITPDMVLGPPRQGLKVTYATDCRPSRELVEFVKNSDLYIGEGLYGQPDKLAGAREKGHMIYSEAAKVARAAQAKELWLTHFSPALISPEMELSFALDIFPNSRCGKNLLKTTLKFVE